MKQFDCQEMPKKVKEAYFDSTEGGNDVWLEWFIEEHEDTSYNVKKVNKWLKKQGCKNNTEVLIKHWW